MRLHRVRPESFLPLPFEYNCPFVLIWRGSVHNLPCDQNFLLSFSLMWYRFFPCNQHLLSCLLLSLYFDFLYICLPFNFYLSWFCSYLFDVPWVCRLHLKSPFLYLYFLKSCCPLICYSHFLLLVELNLYLFKLLLMSLKNLLNSLGKNFGQHYLFLFYHSYFKHLLYLLLKFFNPLYCLLFYNFLNGSILHLFFFKKLLIYLLCLQR